MRYARAADREFFTCYRTASNAVYLSTPGRHLTVREKHLMDVCCIVASARRRMFSAAAATIVVVFMLSGDASAADTCEQLRALSLPDHATVTDTRTVAPNVAPFFARRAFCRVFLKIAPTTDSDIKVEVWLPIGGWNGKLQAVGNGDAAGVISYDGMIEAVGRGFATSSTDTGHVGNTMAFALGHRDKYVDFGYRAVHEMTISAKAIVEAFFGTAPTHAYWNGCSQGGRQGITEAIRYPSDFDAIIAGAPPVTYMQLHAVRLALNRFVHRSADSYIPPEKYPLIHRAALDACDVLDGVADGLIADPSACRFDPAILECRNGDEASCLTPSQVATARGMYSPITDPATGQVVSAPLLQPGSELGWGRLAGAEPLTNAVEPFKYVVFNNREWNWRAFRLKTDLPRALQVDGGVVNRTDANLQTFFDAGGKLLMYHGWSDPQVPPLATIGYFNAVLRATGAPRRGTAIELYMQPGVNHCWGGEGPDTFDAVGALDQWVLTGHAPTHITALHTSEVGVDRTRPLCPYPEVAQYIGTGSVDQAANFRCVTERRPAQPTSSARRTASR
jgi:feruloyl esterase